MTPFRWILTILSFATAVGMSVVVIASSWPESGGAPLGLPWASHFLLAGAVLVEIVLRVLKITYSAKAVGIPVRFTVAARTVLGGDFAAAMTPSRTGAEPARFLALSEAGIRGARAVLVLFLELFLEMLSLIIIAAVLAVLLRGSGGVLIGLVTTVSIYAAGVLGTGVLAFAIAKSGATGPPPGWARALGMNAGTWRKVQRWLRHVRDGVHALRRSDPLNMSIALVCSVLHVGARLLALPIVVYSYAPRSSIPAGQLILWPLILLYGAAVAPAPGGGGIVELAFKASLGRVIPDRLLGASLIWWRVYSFYIYVAIGALATGRTVMRALKRRRRAVKEDELVRG